LDSLPPAVVASERRNVGIYKAFRERGVMFDVFVGTSSARPWRPDLQKNLEAEDLERGTHEIFVRSRSFRRQPGRATPCWITRHFDRALAINTATTAGSRIAGGPSRRSQPIFDT